MKPDTSSIITNCLFSIIKNIQYIDSLLVEYEIQNASAEKIFKARVNKVKYEQQLQVARNQIARMSGDTIL